MSTVLKAADSAEFLGLVPALAGFTPRESLVLVPFQHKRAHGAMRIDLPRDHARIDDYVDSAVGLLSRVSGLDAMAAVVYTDELPLHTPDGLVLPQTIAVEELLAVAVSTGLRVVDALCVMPSGWSSYLDDDPQLGPLDEIPLPPPVPDLPDVSADQDAGTGLPAVDLAERERVGAALRDLDEVLQFDGPRRGERENPQALAAAVMLDDLPMFFEMMIEHPDGPPPFATAALLWCLDRPALRDAALLQWATDLATGIRAYDAQIAYSATGRAVPDDLGQMLIGTGDAPDPERLRSSLALMRAVAARAPRASRPAPLTLAAWTSWALGRSSHAQHYLDAAREIDPDYSLAQLVNTLVDVSVLPEWVFRRGGSEEIG